MTIYNNHFLYSTEDMDVPLDIIDEYGNTIKPTCKVCGRSGNGLEQPCEQMTLQYFGKIEEKKQ